MTVVSTGQITIIDIQDNVSLNAYITSGSRTSQVYNSDTGEYNPDYTRDGQTLSLNLTRMGSNVSVLQDVQNDVSWYKVVNGERHQITNIDQGQPVYLTGVNKTQLVIKENTSRSDASIRYIAEGLYTDTANGNAISFSASIDLVVLETGKSPSILNIYGGKGVVFFNSQPGQLTINADLYKSGVISDKLKNIKFFAADTSVISATHSLYDSDAGLGWRKITSLSTSDLEYVSTGFGVDTLQNGVLTVKPNAITNYQTYKVVVQDKYGIERNKKHYGSIIIADYTDPIAVVIETSAGTVFKNNNGQTTLTAKLYKSGDEVDPQGTKYQYRWFKRLSDGSLVSNFGGSSAYKTGKSLLVASTEVVPTAVFQCEVHQ